jgi:hypothetical protein
MPKPSQKTLKKGRIRGGKVPKTVVPKIPGQTQKLQTGINTTLPKRVSQKKHIILPKQNTPGRKFTQLNCSPIVRGKRKLKESCMTGSVLLRIRDEYNRDQTDPKNQIHTKNYKKLWIELYRRLSDCNDESCWLKRIAETHLQKQIEDEIFAPKHPKEWQKNPNEWLSNFDIMGVIRQYEKTYPNFKLLGPTTIDFDSRPRDMGGNCVSNDICQISLQALKRKGKTKIAIVFNLDKHTGSGTHWMSAFIDLDDQFIYYFDSASNPVPDEIHKLVERLIQQGKMLKPRPIHLKYYTNVPKTHQKSSSECGMYSLFFIITMLTNEVEFDHSLTLDKKLNLFSNVNIPDGYVMKYRERYFN